MGILITSLYRRIAFQADLVASYQDLEIALRIQKQRGDEFERELRGWITIASLFLQFAQHKYERSRTAWCECHVEAD